MFLWKKERTGLVESMVVTLEAARKPVGLEIGQAFKVALVCISDRNTFFGLRNTISYITSSIGVAIQALHLRGRLDNSSRARMSKRSNKSDAKDYIPL